MLAKTTVIAGWNKHVVNLTNHTPAGQYIAARHGLGSTSKTLYIDDVTLELISPNDLAALSITGNPTPSVGIGTNYEVTVYNNGTATQSNYQIQIVDGIGTVLASTPGAALAPDTTYSTALTITPAAEGPMALYAKVVLTGDVNPVNDLAHLNIVVMPADVVMITVGVIEPRCTLGLLLQGRIHETIYLQWNWVFMERLMP